MDIIKQKKNNFLINNLDKVISYKLIKKYLEDRDFESAIFYILRVYYNKLFLKLNKQKKLDTMISFLKNKYLDKYYNYNENNINAIVIEIGIIIKNKDGYKSVINKYNNTIEQKLNDFFLGRYSGTFLGTKVLPRYI
jgi:hypothetical protein